MGKTKGAPEFKKTKKLNKHNQKGGVTVSKVRKKRREKHKWRDVREHNKKKVQAEGTIKETTEIGKAALPKAPSLNSETEGKKTKAPVPVVKESLRERMLKRLDAARFRQVNEDLDSATKNTDPVSAFQDDPEQFRKYHDAYRERVQHWPKNPLDQIIKWVSKKMNKDKVIADFGCGEARLAASVTNTVHSFDLFALSPRVTACDMRSVPIPDESVDIAIFCLSLMGTDVSKFIGEANRVLKMHGALKIAEVASRFSGKTYTNFVARMKKFGFTLKKGGQGERQGTNSNDDQVFLMFEFKKVKSVKAILGRLPALKLNPSVYKKR